MTRGWDPEHKRYMPIKPDLRGRMRPDGSVVPGGADMSWLGEPPTPRQAAAYELKRRRILEAAGLDPDTGAPYRTEEELKVNHD